MSPVCDPCRPTGSHAILQRLSTFNGRSTISTLADVNLNRLAVFVAVVDAGSLSAAARRLGIATTMMPLLVGTPGTSSLKRLSRLRLNS